MLHRRDGRGAPRHGDRAWCALLLALAIGASAFVVAGPAAAIEDSRPCAMSLPQTVSHYAFAFAQRGPSWAGGDVTGSVPLPDGRILWLFGDTFYAGVAPNGAMIDPVVHNNSAFVQSGSCFDRLGSRDRQWIVSPWPGEILWPQSAYVEDGLVRVFLNRVLPTGGGGCFAFRLVGAAIATFGSNLADPLSVVAAPTTGDRGFGWGVHDLDGYTWLYAHRDDLGTLVARVPIGSSVTDFSAWRYWNGSDWVDDPAAAVSIDPGAMHIVQDASSTQHALRIICAASRVAEYFTGDTPLGAWHHDATHDLDMNALWYPGATWSYLATLHPWVPLADGSMLATFNFLANTEAVLHADVQLYGARAAEVPSACAPDCLHESRSAFVPSDGVRLADSRSQTGLSGPLVANRATALDVRASGAVPADASAVVVNVTATRPATTGWISAFPGGDTYANTSTVNFDAGETVAAAAIVPIGPDGTIQLLSNTATDVVVDLQGWFVPGDTADSGRYQALPPTRLVDTRSQAGRLRAGQETDVQVLGRGGVPAAGVSAVALQVTAVSTDGSGFVSARPSGTAPATVSNVNLSAPNETRANLVIVPVGTGGAVTLSTSVGLDLVVDVAGWFTDQSAPQGKSGMYVPLPAARVTDTRLVGATPAPFSTTVVQVAGKAGVPPGEIAAVAVNVTATQPRVPGYVSVFPHGVGRPVASTTNTTRDNQTTMSLTLTGIGVGGSIDVFTQGGADVIADVSGYFVAAPS